MWHFHCSATWMWELHRERSAVSRWPFTADSDIARWWEGSIVRVIPQPTLHQDQICIFIQVRCQAWAGSKNSMCGSEKGHTAPWLEQKRTKDIWESDFSPTGKSKSACLTFPSLGVKKYVMLKLTARPNWLTVRYVCIVTLERKRLSGQKQKALGDSAVSPCLVARCVRHHFCRLGCWWSRLF